MPPIEAAGGLFINHIRVKDPISIFLTFQAYRFLRGMHTTLCENLYERLFLPFCFRQSFAPARMISIATLPSISSTGADLEKSQTGCAKP